MKWFTSAPIILTVVFCFSVFKVQTQSLSLDVPKDVGYIFFPWSEWLEPRLEFSGRYAFQSYQIVPETNQLCLMTSDSRFVIYDLDLTAQPKETIEIEGQVDKFCYSEGYYYFLRPKDILKVDPKTKEITRVAEFEAPNEFFVQYYYVEAGKHYILTADERTFILEDGNFELLTESGWRHKGNYQVYAEIQSGRGLELSTPSGRVIQFTGGQFEQRTNTKILSAVPVGSTGDRVYLDVELDNGDTIPSRILYTLNHEGDILAQSSIPFMYYIDLGSPWCIVENTIYYILTTPEGFYLVKNCDFSNIKLTAPYHYNYSLPANLNEGEAKTESESREVRSGNNCVTRTQAVARALTYKNMQWTSTSSNWVSNCTTIPGGTTKYRTPIAYSSSGTKTSIPYKWGGFTKWTDWMSFVSSGRKTGNYFTSNNSTCTGTAYSSESDTYVIGLDCSGAVTRWWEYYPKQSTNSLPGISTYLGESNTQAGFSSLKKGDIVNNAGSHTRMCINDNPTGTATFIEASAGNWNVQQKTYSYSELTGYKSYKYNNIIDSRLKLAQAITLSPTLVNKNCPLAIQYKIKNEGTESWTGKVLLVLIQSNGVEVGLDGPYTVTLTPNQNSSLFTYNSSAFNYPTGSSKIEVRVKNNTSTCNYGLYYATEGGAYQNPKSFVIYNNCGSAVQDSGSIIVDQSKKLSVHFEEALPTEVYLYDITGKVIKAMICDGYNCEFNLESLPAGFFIAAVIQNGHMIKTERIVMH